MSPDNPWGMWGSDPWNYKAPQVPPPEPPAFVPNAIDWDELRNINEQLRWYILEVPDSNVRTDLQNVRARLVKWIDKNEE